MRVSGISRRARHDPEVGPIYAAEDLDPHLADADYVVVAAPLTSATRGLFDDRRLSSMKASARLINVGRGPIVVTDALVRALRQGRIAGAALDVFEEEPLPADHPLWELPQVMISSHMAGDFIGWREALTEQFTENLRRFLAGEALENVVDKRRGYVPSSTPEET
jgi:phosphoglycerate dehydrogenase-like enzyme